MGIGVSYGYDTRNIKYSDLLALGVIDPVKVVEMSLRDITSVAGLVVITEVALINKLNSNKP